VHIGRNALKRTTNKDGRNKSHGLTFNFLSLNKQFHY
jgi:hypothetical protein